MSDPMFDGYKDKMVGRLYGVLCEREKGGEWKKFLEAIQIELMGFNGESINYWQLRAKLGALHMLNFEKFRSTIFECINLVQGLSKNELS